MKITMTRNTLIAGKEAAAGKTYDVSEKDAAYLIAIGKAVPAESAEAAKAKESAELAELEKADAEKAEAEKTDRKAGK